LALATYLKNLLVKTYFFIFCVIPFPSLEAALLTRFFFKLIFNRTEIFFTDVMRFAELAGTQALSMAINRPDSFCCTISACYSARLLRFMGLPHIKENLILPVPIPEG